MKSLYVTFNDEEFEKLNRLKKKLKISWYKLITSLFKRPLRDEIIKFFDHKKKKGRPLASSKQNYKNDKQ